MGDPIRDLVYQAVRQNRPLEKAVAEVVRLHGSLPEDAVPWIANAYQVAHDVVRRVAAATAQAGRRPCDVLLCRGEACMAANGRAIERAVCERLKTQPGQTTRDGRFAVQVIYCLGNCENAPSLVIGEDLIDCATPQSAQRAIDRARLG